MTLLHPWAIGAGAAAIGLPLAIHWLTRPRPVRLPLSTIRFVLEAVQQRRARLKLRDVLILLLRIAAVALIACAFARPHTQATALLAADAGADTVRLVVLDQSQSMAAAVHGVAAFDRAKPIASKYLSGTGARGALIFAAARPRTPFDRPSNNFTALREELSGTRPLPERLNLAAAINVAAEMFGSGGEGRRHELVIVSDFQRSNWSAADFSPLPKDTVIHLESVAPAETPANVAVLAVRAVGRVEKGRELRIEVDIGNYSPAPRDVQAELKFADATYPLHGLCPSALVTTLTTTIVPATAGWQAGEARLVGVDDALAADDVRAFVLDVRTAATYLLVTREPSKPQPTSSHLLERALVPGRRDVGDPAKQGERVIRVMCDALDRDAIAPADLVVLDHPGPLSPANITLLAGEMRRGRPVLYVAAEPVDASNLKLLADAAGTDLKLPVEYFPVPAGQARRNLFLTEMKADQAPFLIFGDAVAAATGGLRFSGGLGSRPAPAASGGLADDILATFSDHSACLVTSACGAGSLTVLNADLGKSSLPSSPVFVPLVGELVNRLLGNRGIEAAVPCGEATARYLPASAGLAEGLVISPIDGAAGSPSEWGTLVDDHNSVLWRWDAAGKPGVYQVSRGARPLFALATALPADESDLQPIDPAVLKGRLAGGRSVTFQSAADDAESHDRTWAWLMAICAVCMVVEVGVLKVFKT
jgi:hypothetical protein